MTIPTERWRALRWAREWLTEVQRDPLVPDAAKCSAAELLTSYPSEATLRDLVARRVVGLPANVVEPLADAVEWIGCVWLPDASADTRRKLMFVRRHLPSKPEVTWQRADETIGASEDLFGIRQWIYPDESAQSESEPN